MGKILMRAWHSAGLLRISISDDGRGIEEKAVREKILEKKLAAPEMLENISGDELYSFLMLPGFTTKPDVSEISGRGVGADYAARGRRDNINKLNCGRGFDFRA